MVLLRIILIISILFFDQTNYAAMNKSKLRKEFLSREYEPKFESLINLGVMFNYVKWIESQLIISRNSNKKTENDIIEKALSVYGVKEIKGKYSNPRIMEMFTATGKEWVKDDATAWCSAYVNWVAITKGYEASGELNARSWLKVGESIEKDDLKQGDIIIFWRESRRSWKGHVAFYIGEDEENYHVLGGNQGDTVKIAPYPKSRFLGARRLNKL